jgi:predicted nucleic acid-binding protein
VSALVLLNEEDCYLPAVVVAEIAYGIAKLELGIKRSKLTSQLTEWRVRFADRMIGFNDTTAMIYGDLMATARASGHVISVHDGQIAACALEHDFSLATRNSRDFSSLPLTLVNPWSVEL